MFNFGRKRHILIDYLILGGDGIVGSGAMVIALKKITSKAMSEAKHSCFMEAQKETPLAESIIFTSIIELED